MPEQRSYAHPADATMPVNPQKPSLVRLTGNAGSDLRTIPKQHSVTCYNEEEAQSRKAS